MDIKDTNFITIQGWMRTKFGLKGNDLLVYAVIYGFSQTDGAKFTGSRKYLAEWCGCSMATVDRTLNTLIDKGLISKTAYITKHGYRAVEYSATYPTSINDRLEADPQTETTDDPRTPDYEPQPLLDEPQAPAQPKKTRKAKSFDTIIDAYTSDPTTKDLLGAWLQNRKAKRSVMTDRAIQGNINKLDQCARESRMSVNDYLDEVVCRGWSSFFTIENYKRTGYQQKPQQQSTQPHCAPTEDEEERQRREADEEWLRTCVF
jgi:predicted transcriptional regulator